MKVLGEEGQGDQQSDNNSVKNNNNQNSNNAWNHRSTQNDWNQRPQQRNNNQPRNNRWNNRDENSQQQPLQSRENNQQINQIAITDNTNSDNNTTHSINKLQSNEESYSPYVQCVLRVKRWNCWWIPGQQLASSRKKSWTLSLKRIPLFHNFPLTE
ncbi:bifunctional endo-1,4-beta-xylanase XylA-like [Aphis gossypii]|uniref:bifunctional endo-1,4-beta-xylanase XylA-like n=1 Tax=Aphis gossypii TaxID=80765 RepID=UPI00215929E3|nr:bifunctional endo-1,4-beta-xylanase XylA-like [Aphis gossypii]